MTNALLDLIGLRPVLVPDLGQDAIILTKEAIILIDTKADMERVTDRALAAAVALEAGRTA